MDIDAESVDLRYYLPALVFIAVGLWLSCGSTIKGNANIHRSIIPAAEAAVYSPAREVSPAPSVTADTGNVSIESATSGHPASLPPQPLLECRGILDTVSHLNKVSYTLIEETKEELSEP